MLVQYKLLSYVIQISFIFSNFHPLKSTKHLIIVVLSNFMTVLLTFALFEALFLKVFIFFVNSYFFH